MQKYSKMIPSVQVKIKDRREKKENAINTDCNDKGNHSSHQKIIRKGRKEKNSPI